MLVVFVLTKLLQTDSGVFYKQNDGKVMVCLVKWHDGHFITKDIIFALMNYLNIIKYH